MRSALERCLVLALPLRDREALVGDLNEEDGVAGWSRTAAVLGVVASYQVEPYRDADVRNRLMALVVAGLFILWAVPAAAWAGTPDTTLYDGPLFALVAALWSTAHVAASLAAGLLIGHLGGIPAWAEASRWHGWAVLAAFAWTLAPDASGGFWAVACLAGAAVFGARARKVEPEGGARVG